MEEKRVIQDDEIDLTELIKMIWSGKWFIAKMTGLFIILGLVIAFTSPKEYSTSCTLIPEALGSEGKLGGSLGGLASLAGIDIGAMSGPSSTINPGLYRSVAESTPFLLKLMNQEFYFSEAAKKVSMYDYYMEYYQISLFSRLLGIPRTMIGFLMPKTVKNSGVSDDLIRLSREQLTIIENLRQRIVVTMDWELNVVFIEVEMQDPVVTAKIAQFTQNYITDYVTKYSISKSREQLSFVNEQYKIRKIEFKKAQLVLADFRDQNRNVNTARARSEEERLQSEYNLAFNVYNQLAQQLETIKLQVNENTPVFTVLEPVKVPVKKSKPRRLIILVGFVFLGILMSSIFILAKQKL